MLLVAKTKRRNAKFESSSRTTFGGNQISFFFFFFSSVALLMTNRFGIIAEYYSHLLKGVGPQTKHIISFVLYVVHLQST